MLKQIMICGLSALAISALSFDSASAGPNADAKIVLHLVAPTTKNACGRSAATPNCAGIVTAGSLAPQTYFAYLLVTDADPAVGVAGVQCGIGYNNTPQAGVDIYSWTNCATLEFPSTSWPADGGGNLITWDASTRCQRSEPGGAGTGVSAVAGYFYCASYSSDTLRVLPRPVDGVAKVADCDAHEEIIASPTLVSIVSPLGFAVFSSTGEDQGHNPCCGAPPQESHADDAVPQGEILMATVNVPEGVQKTVFLHGKEMKPPYRLTYSNGISYINGLRWQPPIASGNQDHMIREARAARRNIDFSKTPATKLEYYRELPGVQSFMALGHSLAEAAAEYNRRVFANLRDVSSAYKSANSRVGKTQAEKMARVKIDTRIADNGTDARRGPRFSSNGDVSLFFFGFGRRGFFGESGDIPESAPRRFITLDEARTDSEIFQRYLNHSKPAVLVYGSSSNTLASDLDAEQVLREIAQLRAGVNPESILGALLPSGAAREIARVGDR